MGITKKVVAILVLASLMAWGGYAGAASIPGSAGMGQMQDGPNAEGLFFTINAHYEAFDGKDATDPLGVTPGKIQFAYILEYAAGNEYMEFFDLESINGVPVLDTGVSATGSVNGITPGAFVPLSTMILSSPSGNPVVRNVFLDEDTEEPVFGPVGSRSAILAFTVSDQYKAGEIIAHVTDHSLGASCEVAGPEEAEALGVVQGNIFCSPCNSTGQITAMEGVTVKVLGSDGNSVASAVTGGDGQYVIPNVATGDYMVAVDTGSTFTACATKSMAVTVSAGEPAMANFCVCPATPTQQISISVACNATGTKVPVHYAWVGIQGPQVKCRWARTKVDGTALFKGSKIVSGHYTVAVKAPKGYVLAGNSSVEFDIAQGESKSLTFEICPTPPCTQNICVKVVEPGDGNSVTPIPGVAITAKCNNAMTGMTDNSGQVCFSVKTGQHTVTIDVPEGYRLDGDKSVKFCLAKCDQKDVTFTLHAILLGPCPQMPCYWKQHSSAWPVTSMYVGANVLNQTQLMNILSGKLANGTKTKCSDDISMDLAQNLIAVNLSIAAGSDPQDIGPVIIATDEFFLYDYPPGSGPTGRGKDLAKDLKNKLYDWLKDRDYCIGQ